MWSNCILRGLQTTAMSKCTVIFSTIILQLFAFLYVTSAHKSCRRVALPERTAVSIVIRLTNCDVKARAYHVIKQLYTLRKEKKSLGSCFIGALTCPLVCTAFRNRKLLLIYLLSWKLPTSWMDYVWISDIAAYCNCLMCVGLKSTYSLNYTTTEIYYMHYSFFTIFVLVRM